jgi:hypothetical protein
LGAPKEVGRGWGAPRFFQPGAQAMVNPSLQILITLKLRVLSGSYWMSMMEFRMVIAINIMKRIFNVH